MKKNFVIAGILVLTLVLFLSGCTEENSNSAGAKTVTMTAKEMSDDVTWDGSQSSLTIGYNTLNEGDTLIVEDTISNVEYNSTNDWTKIRFEIGNESSSEGLTTVMFYIQGNQTSSYQSGNKVRITNKIKHVQFTNDQVSYDIELLEDQWESEEYFVTHMMTGNYLKPLPSSAIEKI